MFKRSSGITSKFLFLLTSLTALTLQGCGQAGGGDPDFYAALTPAGAGTGVSGLGSGPSPVSLGAAATYVLLAQSAITDVPTSAIVGTVGLSPATGAGIGLSCVEVTGNIHTVDAAGPSCRIQPGISLTNAITDKGTAYTDAAGRSPDYTELGAGNIGSRNLGPAVYKWSSALLIPTNLKLTGGPNDVWIFQVAQGLTVASGVQIILAGGALAKNVYWQVFSADLNTTSAFVGTLISQTNIAVKTGASVNGKLLAGTGITLQVNAITDTP